MPQSHPQTSSPLDALTGDLIKVIRRHDPGWTGSNDSDPGVTLLEIEAWIADRLDFYQPTGSAARTDPYRNFKFRVKWDGAVIAGISRVSALRRTTEIVEHRDGSAPNLVQRVPGRLVYQPITLERPLRADSAFEDWADQLAGAAPGGPASYRKSIRIEVLDQAGRPFLAYDVHGCWPLAYQVLRDFTESLTLVPEGWQRDGSVQPAGGSG